MFLYSNRGVSPGYNNNTNLKYCQFKLFLRAIKHSHMSWNLFK